VKANEKPDASGANNAAAERPAVTMPKLDDTGFVPLFNGKDLDDWTLKIRSNDAALAAKVFAVDQGMVHVFKDFPAEYELNQPGNKTHGLFYTKKKYSKFILRFEYKWGKGIANNFDQFQYDAGLYYHVTNDRIWPTGIEYQVRYNHTNDKNHSGDIWGISNLTWYSGPNQSFVPPSEGGIPTPNKKNERLALDGAPFNGLNGQWNLCEVIVMGNQFAIHKLNGKLVNLATELGISEGIIGFQSETAEIFYRNIRIKELDKDIPMENFLP